MFDNFFWEIQINDLKKSKRFKQATTLLIKFCNQKPGPHSAFFINIF
jgi:hypothetical protein